MAKEKAMQALSRALFRGTPGPPGGGSLDEPMYLLYFSLRTSWALVGITPALFVVVSSVCLVFSAPNVSSFTVTTMIQMKTFHVGTSLLTIIVGVSRSWVMKRLQPYG